MSVTLKQIAEELNVSHVTVANALNGKARVSPAMRLKVQETASRMGYDKSANRAAQAMIARRYGRRIENGAIALIHNMEGEYPWHSIPFYRTLLDGVGHEARHQGVDLYIVLQHGSELPRAVKERRVDGVVFLSGSRLVREELGTLGLPVATLGTYNAGMFNVLPDGKSGLYQATKYLIELGHRDIAYIGGKASLAADRLKGYKRALAEHGLPLNENLIQHTSRNSIKGEEATITQEHNIMELEGREAMKSLLERGRTGSSRALNFTAMVCQNDIIAIGAVREAEAVGLKVPEDLSVIGFDDVSVQYSFQPQLTSVSYASFDMGRRVMQWLCQEAKLLLEQQDSFVWEPEEAVEYFPTHISVRYSTRAIG
jgi:LacI family transcriptional regulator